MSATSSARDVHYELHTHLTAYVSEQDNQTIILGGGVRGEQETVLRHLLLAMPAQTLAGNLGTSVPPPPPPPAQTTLTISFEPLHQAAEFMHAQLLQCYI
eukprot:3318988-Amphidinium_carterae.2